jgi:hypothetical protein
MRLKRRVKDRPPLADMKTPAFARFDVPALGHYRDVGMVVDMVGQNGLRLDCLSGRHKLPVFAPALRNILNSGTSRKGGRRLDRDQVDAKPGTFMHRPTRSGQHCSGRTEKSWRARQDSNLRPQA